MPPATAASQRHVSARVAARAPRGLNFEMQEAPPPAQQGAILQHDSAHPVPVAEEKQETKGIPNGQQMNEDPASTFIDSVRRVFAPCVGVVDAASFLMGHCRFGKEGYETAYDMKPGGDSGVVMKLRERNGVIHKAVQKRQGETLEIPANGGFDDDVSAISAHTLEEMERLQLAQKKSKMHMLTPPKTSTRSRKPNQSSSRVASNRPRGTKSVSKKATRAAFTNTQLWTISRPTMGKNEEDVSIGVSTSGSSSGEEEPAKITTRGRKTMQDPLMKTHRAA
mmetsp:Transcript_21471/g.40094  ORF Transcript_21471/g.40094 Transcript_21471/m.40094 type:complete len:280 (-) Transcript_21471:412-1251(-)